jgi:hypothetical protein
MSLENSRVVTNLMTVLSRLKCNFAAEFGPMKRRTQLSPMSATCQLLSHVDLRNRYRFEHGRSD